MYEVVKFALALCGIGGLTLTITLIPILLLTEMSWFQSLKGGNQRRRRNMQMLCSSKMLTIKTKFYAEFQRTKRADLGGGAATEK